MFLINDILDLSKIEAGRMELELTDFHLPTALDNALILVRERAGRRSITLQMNVDERLGEVRADERKIRQVVLTFCRMHSPGGSRGGVRGVPPGGDGGEEGGRDGVGAHLVPEVHRAPRRADLGGESDRRGLDGRVHHPSALGRLSRAEGRCDWSARSGRSFDLLGGKQQLQCSAGRPGAGHPAHNPHSRARNHGRGLPGDWNQV